MIERTVSLGRFLFEFSSHEDWIDTAKHRYRAGGVATYDTVAIDAFGRICTRGLHFNLADREQTYPIMVYAITANPDGRPEDRETANQGSYLSDV